MEAKKSYILIKRPSYERKHFQMSWDLRFEDGSRKFKSVVDSRIDAVNSAYLSNSMTISEAMTELNKIKISLLPKKFENNQFKTNLNAIDKLFEQISSNEDIKMASLKEAKLDLIRLANILENESITSVTIPLLKNRIKNSKYKHSTQNRLIVTANRLLKFVKRFEKMKPISVDDYRMKYLTLEEMILLLTTTNDEGRLLLTDIEKSIVRIFFYSGLRLGELFALKKNIYNPLTSEYFVTYQLRDTFEYDSLKSKNSKRTIRIIRPIVEDFIRLSELSFEELCLLRNNISKKLLRVSRLTFKDNMEKHISAHDLRHSFAMHSILMGITITQIAKFLGNTEEVCERHYTAGENQSFFLDDFERKLINFDRQAS